MTIEKTDNEIIIKISSKTNSKKINEIIDYFTFQEIKMKSKASQSQINDLILDIKNERIKNSTRIKV